MYNEGIYKEIRQAIERLQREGSKFFDENDNEITEIESILSTIANDGIVNVKASKSEGAIENFFNNIEANSN